VKAAVRQYRSPDDFEAVIELWQSVGDGIHLGESDTLEELTKKYDHDPDLFLVAEKHGELVGSVLGGFDGRRGLVYHLAVRAEERQLGLGSRLMEEVERRLRGKGCRRVYLLVTNDNTAAMRFYERRGWGEMDLHIYAKNIS
jgi:ribosomal protein S18 acetylase RimI-like enzyme